MKSIKEFVGAYAFLSNFYPCEMVYAGIKYKTSEHAYQAAKTLDFSVRLHVAQLATPAIAKKYCRTIKVRDDWDDIKLAVMKEILLIKFNQPAFRYKLLATGNAWLEEGNTWSDYYWGVCRGKGENWLGKLLMYVRAYLRGQMSLPSDATSEILASGLSSEKPT